jgi:hypothetical protein
MTQPAAIATFKAGNRRIQQDREAVIMPNRIYSAEEPTGDNTGEAGWTFFWKHTTPD